MDHHEAWKRMDDAPIGRMATVTAAGRVDLVPIVFALIEPAPGHRYGDGILVTAVDHKPKRTPALKRLDNIKAHPELTVLVDHYDDDWDQLWWIRLRGLARVVDDADFKAEALDALVAKYTQYQRQPPDGSVIAVDILGLQGWAAADF